MPRSKAQTTTNKKVLTVTDEVHKAVMSISKRTKASANDVIASLLSKADRNQVVADIKAEQKNKEAEKKAEAALRKDLLKKAKSMDSAQLKKLLDSA